MESEEVVRLRSQVEHALTALKLASHLLPLVTVRAVIEAGYDAIDAAGLNPYCINEGLADGHESIGTLYWLDDAIADLEGREMPETLRAEFETWVSSPPYGRSVQRHTFEPPYADAEEPWVAGYCDFAVEMAWRAWQRAHNPARTESVR